MLLPRGQSLRAEPKKYVFGFAQATITESWRVRYLRMLLRLFFDRNVDTDQYTQFIGGDILRLGGQRESML